MCGFAGFLDLQSSWDPQKRIQIVHCMNEQLTSRGPDDHGLWVDVSAGIALGHRRLAVLDLSPEGHQPMVSPDGRYVLAYNGEIYNFPELRKRLESESPHPFRGSSDTEVLLQALALWGPDKTLPLLRGMFAWALWDRKERSLTLARDRAGEKPLYYGWQGSSFLFGSELKALRAHPHWKGQLDPQALNLFLKHAYVPSPHSIYTGICKLPPGCTLTLSEKNRNASLTPRAYWKLPTEPFQETRNEREWVQELKSLLESVIQEQSFADVPLGAFLSGGIDSSLIVSLMQRQSSRRIQTFTVGFEDSSYDESPYARDIARHLNTEHTEVRLTTREAQAVIPDLAHIYDEPFADSSQIPTLLIARTARRHVTVCLSGDAGDELFGGYTRYLMAPRLWSRLRLFPRPLTHALSSTLLKVPPHKWNHWGKQWRLKTGVPWDARIQKLAHVLNVSTRQELHRRLLSIWQTSPLKTHEPAIDLELNPNPDFLTALMRTDFLQYLPDDILVKVDRAAMSTSLETRIPFLDSRVIELASRLPNTLKIRNQKTKWILRKILEEHLPSSLFERPKQGFGIPLGDWLRGDLKDWASELLRPQRLEREGFLDAQIIQEKWQEHQKGQRDHQAQLWCILMFESWLEKNHRPLLRSQTTLAPVALEL